MERTEIIKLIKTKVYAGRAKDKEILLSSSSGGAFTVISDWFLKNRDAVIAASYNYETHAEVFKLTHTIANRDNAIGSKYVQSRLGNILRATEVGRNRIPKKICCLSAWDVRQAEGFRKFVEIKGFRDCVYIIDIICHGSPSPKLWKEYAQSIENKAGGGDYIPDI